MKSIQVMLSAYNGCLYLSQQIESILAQENVEVSLLIRDDGSTDQTMKLLQTYEKRYPNISVYAGSNRGAAGSFYDLLQNAGRSFDYYAFADQDDIWFPDKLSAAVAMLETESDRMPLLYAGKVICASKDLKKREAFSYRTDRKPDFGNALLENICMGCTQVFNRPLLILVREHLMQRTVMHDWWMYLTAAYFGKVIYDQHAYMLYRQHDKNIVGMKNQWGKRWRNRIRHFSQMKHKLSDQAELFRMAYAPIVKDDVRLRLLCEYRRHVMLKLKLIFSKSIYRQNRLDDIVCRLLFIISYL